MLKHLLSETKVTKQEKIDINIKFEEDYWPNDILEVTRARFSRIILVKKLSGLQG